LRVLEQKRPWFRWPIWIGTLAFFLSCIYMTHVPRPPGFTNIVPWDKMKHFLGFGTLASMFYFSIWLKGVPRWKTALIVVCVLAMYAGLDERTQPWTGRDCDIHDWYADMCGTVFASLFWSLLRAMLKQMPE
jgi:VanZ family protein